MDKLLSLYQQVSFQQRDLVDDKKSSSPQDCIQRCNNYRFLQQLLECSYASSSQQELQNENIVNEVLHLKMKSDLDNKLAVEFRNFIKQSDLNKDFQLLDKPLKLSTGITHSSAWLSKEPFVTLLAKRQTKSSTNVQIEQNKKPSLETKSVNRAPKVVKRSYVAPRRFNPPSQIRPPQNSVRDQPKQSSDSDEDEYIRNKRFQRYNKKNYARRVRRDEEEEEEEEEEQPKCDFRTAAEQFRKDQVTRKRQNDDDPYRTYGNAPKSAPSSYGAPQKFHPVTSLKASGALTTNKAPSSGVKRKFTPPFKKKDDEPAEKKIKVGEGKAKDLKELFPNGEVPEKFKNLDPSLVEMICNEIMLKDVKVKWDDIAGLKAAKESVIESVIWPMLRPDIFKGLRGPPKGLLLFGPPGTGKTMIGKAIASESGATFFNISASSLMSKWVGEGEKLVRTLFAVASYYQPAVIFIDEIDSLLSARTEQDSDNVTRRMKTEFLVQLDGAGTNSEDRVLIVGATNRPQDLDEAVRRRLVKRLYIPLPNHEARKAIIESLIKQSHYELTDEEIVSIVKKTEGYSGADMKELCVEAALGPCRDIRDIKSIDASSVRPIQLKDFENALKVIRPSVSQKDIGKYEEWNKTYGSFGT